LYRGAREKAEESLRKIEAFTAEMQRTPRKKERSFASLRMTTPSDRARGEKGKT